MRRGGAARRGGFDSGSDSDIHWIEPQCRAMKYAYLKTCPASECKLFRRLLAKNCVTAMDPQVDATAEVPYTLPDVEKTPVSSDNQSDIVDFEGEDDPKDPLNWSSRYKWSMVILISILSLVV